MYNNRNYDRGYNNYGGRDFAGYGPVNRPRRAPFTLMKSDGYDLIRKERYSNGAQIREYDVAVAKCTHIHPRTGEPVYRQVSPGVLKCDICGTEWPTEVISPEEVRESCQKYVDSLQTFKLAVADSGVVDKALASTIASSQAVVKIYPNLYETVLRAFNQSFGDYRPNYNRGASRDFENLDSFVSNGYGNRGREYPRYGYDRYDRDPYYERGYDPYRYDRQPEEYYDDPRRGYGYDAREPYYRDERDYGYDNRDYGRRYDRRNDLPPAPRFNGDSRRDSNPFAKDPNANRNNTDIPITDGNSNQQPNNPQVPTDQKVVNNNWKV